MHARSLYLVILLGATVLLSMVAISTRQPASMQAETPNDAAFRDGLYQARQDIAQKRPAHIMTGRWSTEQDRASYVAGYRLGYQTAGTRDASDPVQIAGYSDGLVDGARDRKASRAFQVGRADKFRQAELMYGGAASELYRQAYKNGYQQGYYTPTSESVEVVGQDMRRF